MESTANARDTVGILSQLKITLSSPLSGNSENEQPQVVQVLYEIGKDRQNLALTPVASIRGVAELSGRSIFWQQQTRRDQLIEELSSTTGRILIRIHCGAITDVENRPFSSSTDVLHGTSTPHAPGGVFESWFMVN